MTRIVTTAVAIALAGAAMVSTAGTAEARPGWHGYHGHYAYGPRYGYRGYRRGRADAAVAAGLAGALIGGAIIASQQPRYDYYGGPAYGAYPAYGPGGYYGY